MPARDDSHEDLQAKGAVGDGTQRRLGIALVAGSIALVLLASAGASARERTPDTARLTPDQQVAQLDAMCAEAQPAMAARQAERKLYDRLGGRESIHAVVDDVVRRHQNNEAIAHLLDGVDLERLVNQVTDFLASATGGDVVYRGRDLRSSHARLELTDADFLAAGGDVEAALVAAGVGPEEIQEVMCSFVFLRGEVVTK